VALYNSAVEHLAATVSCESLVQFSWPCEEISNTSFSFKGLYNTCAHYSKLLVSCGLGAPPLYWNEAQHLASLNEKILSLRISPPQLNKGFVIDYKQFIQLKCIHNRE